MDQKRSPLTLRGFLNDLEQRDPAQILRVQRRVEPAYDTTAVVMGLEAKGRSPVVWFEKVGSSPFPVVTNLFGARSRYALALGVREDQLTEAWAAQNDRMIEPCGATRAGP